jgi:hypothetical protein
MAISLIPAASAVSGTLPAANLPAGSVLQVVSASYGSIVTNGTSSYANSGLTATITPKFSTSKIFVLISMNDIEKSVNSTYAKFNLVRAGTQISEWTTAFGYTGTTTTFTAGASLNYLDSPASTSATEYRVQFLSQANNANIKVNANSSTSSYITLMEIAG